MGDSILAEAYDEYEFPHLRTDQDVKNFVENDPKDAKETIGTFLRRGEIAELYRSDARNIHAANIHDLRMKLLTLEDTFENFVLKVSILS